MVNGNGKKIAIIILLFLFFSAATFNYSVAIISQSTLRSVVRIICETNKGTRSGSGMIISNDGYILTNKHVVSDDSGNIYSDCFIGITSDEFSEPAFSYTAETILAAKGVDLALLKINSSKTDFDYSRVFLYYLPSQGVEIEALGYPLMGGDKITYTRGYVSGVIGSQDDPGNFFIKADLKIDAGNSGGPSFTTQGEFVGINSAILAGKYNSLDLIIPSTTILEFLRVNSYEYLVTGTQITPSSPLQFREYTESKKSLPDIPPDGTIIEYKSDYYLVDEGRKRELLIYSNYDSFNNCGFNLSDVKMVSREVFNALPEGYLIRKFAKGGRPCYVPISEESRRSFPDGTLIKLSFKYWPKLEADTIYLIENSKKRPFTSWEIFKSLGYDLWKWDYEGSMNYPSYYTLNEAEFSQYSVGEPITSSNPPGYKIPEGALIRAAKGIDIYIVKYVKSKKFKRLVLSPSVFESYGHLKWEDVIEVDNETIDSFTTSELVRAVGDSRVYKLYPQGDTGQKRWIKTAEAFARMDFDSDSIYEINAFDRDSYVVGIPLE